MQCDDLRNEDSNLKEILEVIREEMIKTQRPANEIILDDVDLRNLLKISERTTAALRAKNMITYSKPGKVFYLLSDVLKMLNNYKIESIVERMGK
jgi:methyltransferase-like protein